jgi:hypothetical protein
LLGPRSGAMPPGVDQTVCCRFNYLVAACVAKRKRARRKHLQTRKSRTQKRRSSDSGLVEIGLILSAFPTLPQNRLVKLVPIVEIV